MTQARSCSSTMRRLAAAIVIAAPPERVLLQWNQFVRQTRSAPSPRAAGVPGRGLFLRKSGRPHLRSAAAPDASSETSPSPPSSLRSGRPRGKCKACDNPISVRKQRRARLRSRADVRPTRYALWRRERAHSVGAESCASSRSCTTALWRWRHDARSSGEHAPTVPALALPQALK